MQHQSNQNKHFSSTEQNQFVSLSSKKYVKITEQVKETFLKYIIEGNMSIKKASEALRINYSSAKAILSNHKRTIRKNKVQVLQTTETALQSSYRTIEYLNLCGPSKLKVTCSVGGKSIISKGLQKTKIIFKPSILIHAKQTLE